VSVDGDEKGALVDAVVALVEERYALRERDLRLEMDAMREIIENISKDNAELKEKVMNNNGGVSGGTHVETEGTPTSYEGAGGRFVFDDENGVDLDHHRNLVSLSNRVKKNEQSIKNIRSKVQSICQNNDNVECGSGGCAVLGDK